MSFQVHRFDSIEDFHAATSEYLLRQEAAHCLMIGLTQTARERSDYSSDLLMAALEEDGRIVGAALRTPPRALVLSRIAADDLPAAAAALAEGLYDPADLMPGLLATVEVAQAFVPAYTARSGQQARVEVQERVFQLERVIAPPPVPGRMRLAGRVDLGLVADWVLDFQAEALPHEVPSRGNIEAMVEMSFALPHLRGFWLWEDAQGRPVSLAGHTGPTPNGIRIGPVYTPPQERGKGYASACVAALSQHHLDQGRRYCFLFTDLANPTSNHIYQQIGYVGVADFEQLRFDPLE